MERRDRKESFETESEKKEKMKVQCPPTQSGEIKETFSCFKVHQPMAYILAIVLMSIKKLSKYVP